MEQMVVGALHMDRWMPWTLVDQIPLTSALIILMSCLSLHKTTIRWQLGMTLTCSNLATALIPEKSRTVNLVCFMQAVLLTLKDVQPHFFIAEVFCY
jgi:hypothetical protein